MSTHFLSRFLSFEWPVNRNTHISISLREIYRNKCTNYVIFFVAGFHWCIIIWMVTLQSIIWKFFFINWFSFSQYKSSAISIHIECKKCFQKTFCTPLKTLRKRTIFSLRITSITSNTTSWEASILKLIPVRRSTLVNISLLYTRVYLVVPVLVSVRYLRVAFTHTFEVCTYYI